MAELEAETCSCWFSIADTRYVRQTLICSLWPKLIDSMKVKSYFSKFHITSSACNVL